MTTVTASLHHPPTGRYRSRRRAPVAPVPAKADAMPPIPAEAHRPMQQWRPILDDERQSTLYDTVLLIPRPSCCPIKSP
jgi:hypothetical protein